MLNNKSSIFKNVMERIPYPIIIKVCSVLVAE